MVRGFADGAPDAADEDSGVCGKAGIPDAVVMGVPPNRGVVSEMPDVAGAINEGLDFAAEKLNAGVVGVGADVVVRLLPKTNGDLVPAATPKLGAGAADGAPDAGVEIVFAAAKLNVGVEAAGVDDDTGPAPNVKVDLIPESVPKLGAGCAGAGADSDAGVDFGAPKLNFGAAVGVENDCRPPAAPKTNDG